MNLRPFAPLAVGLCMLLAACGGGRGTDDLALPEADARSESAPDPALPVADKALATTSFDDPMQTFDPARWQAAQWSNGPPFLNAWHPDQLSFENGAMKITLEADTRQLTGAPAVSGEIRTLGTHGYGTYSARMRASPLKGAVTALFTYTGPAEGTRHDEIDVEILGDDPTRLSVNYWTDGVPHESIVRLGFDASAGFHEYAFRWTPESIQWFVDGQLVHEERGARGPLPSVPGKLMASLWGAVGAQPWSSDYQVGSGPTHAYFDRIGYAPEPASALVPVALAALSGVGEVAGKASWRATATVAVRDANGMPRSGAVVTGDFSRGGSGLSCTTGSNGSCSILSGHVNRKEPITSFTVRGITGPGMRYDAASNAVSNVLVIRRP